jgi:hypothetical protein
MVDRNFLFLLGRAARGTFFSGVPILFFIIFLTYSTFSNLRELTRKENDQ